MSKSTFQDVACRFVHATAERLPIGKVLVARPHPPSRYEKLIERYRPRGKPNRDESFYLAEDATTLLDIGASSVRHIYFCAPVGLAYRCDPAWLVNAMHDWDEARLRVTPSIERAFRAHWAGEKSLSFSGWEVVCPKIFVCSEMSERDRTQLFLNMPMKELEARVRRHRMGMSKKAKPGDYSIIRFDVAARDLGFPPMIVDAVTEHCYSRGMR